MDYNPAFEPFEIYVTDNDPSRTIWFFHRAGDPKSYIYPASMANVFSVKKDAVAKVLRRGQMPIEATTHDERRALFDLGLVKAMQGARKPLFLRFDLSRPFFEHFGCDILWESMRDELEHLKKEKLLNCAAPMLETTGLTQAILQVDLAKPRRQALAEHLLSSEATEELVGMKDFCCTENNSQ